MDIFQILFYQPIFNLLVFLYNLLSHNLGLAIIVIAIIFKVITGPIVYRQRMQMQQSAQKNGAVDMQAQLKDLQEKYKENPQELLKEQLKLQGNMLAPFRGCLPIIITLILVINVRNVIIDLSNRGWVAFNEVAYVQDAKKSVDSVTSDWSNIQAGENNLEFNVSTGEKDSDKFTTSIRFWVYENDSQKTEFETKSREFLSKNTSAYSQKQSAHGSVVVNNKDNSSSLTLYYPIFKTNDFVIPKQDFTKVLAYIRFRSNVGDNWTVTTNLNSSQASNENLIITKGEKVNLDFFGIDLSKTAIDLLPSGSNPLDYFKSNILPYTIIAIISGLIQYISTKLMTANSKQTAVLNQSKDDLKVVDIEVIDDSKKSGKNNKKKKQKDKNQNMNIEKNSSEIENSNIDAETKKMQDQMMNMNMGGFNVFASAMAVAVALGLLGGGQFVPTGLTLFWTIQGIGDIILAVLAKNFKKFKI